MATSANAYPRSEETFPRSLFGRPTKRMYRAAVKQVILDVKARHGLSSEELAERIGVHKDTVENAENEVSSLEAVTLLNVAYAFGEDAIAPVRNLYLCAPTEQPTVEDRLSRIEAEAASIRRELA